MLEATFAVALFLSTMIFFLWSLVIIFDQLVTQYTLDRAVRIVSVASAATPALRANLIRDEIVKSGALFSIEIQPSDIAMCPLGSSYCNPGTMNVGGPNDWVRVIVVRRYSLPIIGMPLLSRQGVLTRNESRL